MGCQISKLEEGPNINFYRDWHAANAASFCFDDLLLGRRSPSASLVATWRHCLLLAELGRSQGSVYGPHCSAGKLGYC
jgi:hypothetical protein